MQPLEQQLLEITAFAADEQITQWQAQLKQSRASESQLILHIQLAWHLRQRNTQQTLVHIREAQHCLVTAVLTEPLQQLITGRLQLIQADAARLMADLSEAQSAIERCLANLVVLAEPICLADAYWTKAWIMYGLGEIGQRDHALEQAIFFAEAANDQERVKLASAGLARASAFQDLTLAEKRWGEFFTKDLERASAGLATWIHDLHYVLASKRQEIGLAIQHGSKAFQAALASGQIERAITAASNIGFDFARIHDLPAALEWSEKALQLARKMAWPLTIGLCLSEMAEVLRKMQRTGAARSLLTEALDIMAPHAAQSRDMALALNYLGDVELNCGNFDAALTSFSALLVKADFLGHADLQTIACRGCAEALFRAGEHQKAQGFAEKALHLAKQQLDGYNIVEALRVLARIHDQQVLSVQDGCSSLAYLEQAVKIGEQMAGFSLQPDLFEALAQKYASNEQYQDAYAASLKAIVAYQKNYDRRTHEQAMALQIRYEHDKAHRENQYHRKLAEVEKARSESLSAINSSLEQLLVREKQLQRLLEASLDAIVTMDSDGRIVRWSSAAERIFGWQSAEIIGQRLSEHLIPERYRAAHEAGMQRFAATGEGRLLGKTQELSALHRDGYELPVELSLWHVETEAGTLFGALMRDISERKAAEQQLREQEEKYRSVVENGSEGILVVAGGRLVYCNPFMQRTTGRSLDSMIGQPFTSFIHADDVGRVVQNYQRRLRGEEVEQHYEFRILTVAGEEVWVELSAVAIQWEGQPATLSFLNDVTQRRKLQAQLLAKTREQDVILQSTVIGIALFKSQHLQWANRRLELMLGYKHGSLLGRSVSVLFKAEQDWREFLPAVMQTLDTTGAYTGEIELLRANGQPIWLQLHGTRLPPTDDVPISLWTFIDITERKRAESELLNALAREREFGQLKSRFVSMTSHEFRTPLTGIQSSVDLLADYEHQLASAEKHEIFQQIRDSVERMTRMLDNILVIGQGEAQRLSFSPTPIDLATFCRQLLNEVTQSRHTEVLKVQIRLNLDDVEGEWLLDESLLRHALGNLLSNALKYSPEGGVVNFNICAEKDHLRFEIIDQGIGIPEDDQQRLFESFYRASNVGIIPGTGLGLAIVKQSTELHGGKVTVQSRPGQGTIFILDIPSTMASSQ
ncbi:PAS domain S-box protein [Alishewanella sp. d11]|uniref:PAS domain S-box protein n=1 Tax=Alishewanella sp. d11 TaxID=3414030 RepID=UPI003BF7788E